MPTLLFARAARMPATWVPCPLSSLEMVSPLMKSGPLITTPLEVGMLAIHPGVDHRHLGRLRVGPHHVGADEEPAPGLDGIEGIGVVRVGGGHGPEIGGLHGAGLAPSLPRPGPPADSPRCAEPWAGAGRAGRRRRCSSAPRARPRAGGAGARSWSRPRWSSGTGTGRGGNRAGRQGVHGRTPDDRVAVARPRGRGHAGGGGSRAELHDDFALDVALPGRLGRRGLAQAGRGEEGRGGRGGWRSWQGLLWRAGAEHTGARRPS